MEALSQPVVFVPCVDLDLAREFYRNVLGLQLIATDDFAAVLLSGSTQVRVTVVPSLTPHPFTVLGWNVDDIEGVVHSLIDRGVEFLRFDGMDQDDRGVWTAPGGALVCWFHDPDGNTLSITQLP